eukprot:symbB.v1.2.007372.t1/scaffold449.1/size202926/2
MALGHLGDLLGPSLRRFQTKTNALPLAAEIRNGNFWMDYGKAFGAFPSTKAFVTCWVDCTGHQAPLPLDPRKVPPKPSSHVVVATCPTGHPLHKQLRCVARHALPEGLRICYAGEVHTVEDHQKYSQQFSLESGGVVIDAAFFCNEAAFVNHFYGITKDPNCRISEPTEGSFAELCVTKPIGEGEELLVDYGMEHCLRNQVPHPEVPSWARDFAALAELNKVQEEIDQLIEVFADERRWFSLQTRLNDLRLELLSEEGRSQVGKDGWRLVGIGDI